MDLVLVVDSSGSIRDQNEPNVDPSDPLGNDNWQRMMTFLSDVTQQFDQQAIRVGIVQYSQDARVITTLTDPSTARVKIDEMRKEFDGGFTNTADGLRTALDNVLKTADNLPDYHDVVLVITDGFSTINVGDVEYAANDVRSYGDGTFVALVGIQGNLMPSITDYEIQRIAENSGDIVFVPSFAELKNKVAQTSRLLCSYLLGRTPGCIVPGCVPLEPPTQKPVDPTRPPPFGNNRCNSILTYYKLYSIALHLYFFVSAQLVNLKSQLTCHLFSLRGESFASTILPIRTAAS